jgi:hypothetical protein
MHQVLCPELRTNAVLFLQLRIIVSPILYCSIGDLGLDYETVPGTKEVKMITDASEPMIVEVTADTIEDHPQVICFINQKNEYYHLKIEWLKQQFGKGLRIKLLYIKGVKRPIGFIEYTPGEQCWRAVSAKGYMFVHCLWTNGKKYQHQGLGNLLVEEVEKDSKKMAGVAVATSDNAFMARKDLFEKRGYSCVEESGKDQLMVKQFGKTALPSINNWQEKLAEYKGLSIVYSKQCPWVARFIEEVKPILAEKNLEAPIKEISTAEDAQHAPSLYGVFSLIYNGKLLADRYISTTRFRNIIEKELS